MLRPQPDNPAASVVYFCSAAYIAKMRVLQMWMKEDPPTGVLPECDLIAVNGLLADLEHLAGRAS